jgi:hypothetical protein
MPSVQPPASIAGIPGLDHILQNGGWQLLAGVKGDPSQTTTFGTATAGGMRSSRTNFIPAFSTSHVCVVYANYCGANVGGETPGSVTQRVKFAMEYLAGTGQESSETGKRLKGFFRGEREGVIAPGQILISDPIEFQATAGVPFFVRARVQLPGSGYPIPLPNLCLGGTGAGGSNNGEGNLNAKDCVDFTNDGSVTQFFGSAWAPVAVLGYSAVHVPSLAMMGDSIMAGSFDTGLMGTIGGYGMRIALNQLSQIIYQYPVTPNFPHIRVARGSDTAANWVSWDLSSIRMRLAMLASTTICDYGTNDNAAGTSLATTKANILSIAVPFLKRGKRYIHTTIFPRTNSTDSWSTTTNQNPITGEAVRLALNLWLRDTSASGFVSQASAAAGVSGQCFVHDVAAVAECDISGTLTLNGGYWRPTTGSPILTGTCAGGNSTQLVNTSGLTMTQDQYRGATLRITSGAQAGLQAGITGNTTTAFNIGGVLGAGPASSDTFAVYDTAWTIDGVHGTSKVHQAAAAAFPLSLVV